MQPVLTKAKSAGIVVPQNASPTLAPPRIELSPNDTNGNASTLKQEPEHDDGGEDPGWENASIYEEVLDDTQAFEYPFSESTSVHFIHVDT